MKALKLLGILVLTWSMGLAMAPAHAAANPTITAIDTQGCVNDTVCVTLHVSNPASGQIVLELTGHTPGSSTFVDTGARLVFNIVPGTTTYAGCFHNVSAFTAGHGFNTLRVEVASSTVPNLQGTTTKSVSFSPCSTPPPSPTPTPSYPPTPTPTPTPTPAGSPSPTPTPSASPSPSPTPSASPSPTPSSSPSPSPSPSASPTPAPSGSPTPTPTTPASPGGTPTPTPPAATPATSNAAALAQTGGFDYRLLLAGLLLLVAGAAVLAVSLARSRSAQQ